jgi:hypothetical protein
VSLVWPNLHAASDGWIGSAILLDRTPAGILDRGAPLDDAGDRDGPAIGGLLEGSPGERARCARGVSIGEGHRHTGVAVVDRTRRGLASPFLHVVSVIAQPGTSALTTLWNRPLVDCYQSRNRNDSSTLKRCVISRIDAKVGRPDGFYRPRPI